MDTAILKSAVNLSPIGAVKVLRNNTGGPMPTATQQPELVTKELKERIHDLEVTQEYLLDLLSKSMIDMPVAVMLRIIEAQRALSEGLKEYQDYVREMQG
jgi:hypothetical protein